MLFRTLLLATGLSLAVAQDSQLGRACGLKIAPCPEDMTCVPESPRCKDLNRCTGHCEFKNKYKPCGGHTRYPPPPCPRNTECKDDPRIPGSCGMACDAPGICTPKKAPQCGGFAGLVCPEGFYCYDALDDCDPKEGGADCIGICL